MNAATASWSAFARSDIIGNIPTLVHHQGVSRYAERYVHTRDARVEKDACPPPSKRVVCTGLPRARMSESRVHVW
jgi:hypothetical protein